MTVKRIGWGLIIASIVGIALSFFAVILLHGQAGMRSIPILSIEISIVLLLFGIWLTRADTIENIQPREQTYRLIEQIFNLPRITWVLISFLVIYLLLFLSPVFLRPDLEMKYMTGYIPNLNPIGNDLTVMVDLIKGWATGTRSPYTIQFYPPLTYIFFAPLLLIQSPLALYRFFSLFTFFSYCFLTLLLPLKIIDKKHFSLVLLLFITGLLSYGFQFELERGQYNVFTFLLCLTAIYIFHYHPKYRLLSYFLFSLSVQLKLYPAIFIVMFVDDGRHWKNIILRFIGIGLFNLMLFFVMGYHTFWDFLRSVSAQMVNPSWIGVWNHSISSFISVVKQDGLGLISWDTLRVLRHNAGWIQGLLLLVFLVLFLSALLISYLRKNTGLDPYLLLACTIGALILPISYDYTLSILAAPMILFLSGLPDMRNASYKLISILSILGISLAYFSTLIPYNYRPYFLSNIFPSLFFILVLATILNIMRYENDKVQPLKS